MRVDRLIVAAEVLELYLGEANARDDFTANLQHATLIDQISHRVDGVAKQGNKV